MKLTPARIDQSFFHRLQLGLIVFRARLAGLRKGLSKDSVFCELVGKTLFDGVSLATVSSSSSSSASSKSPSADKYGRSLDSFTSTEAKKNRQRYA